LWPPWAWLCWTLSKIAQDKCWAVQGNKKVSHQPGSFLGLDWPSHQHVASEQALQAGHATGWFWWSLCKSTVVLASGIFFLAPAHLPECNAACSACDVRKEMGWRGEMGGKPNREHNGWKSLHKTRVGRWHLYWFVWLWSLWTLNTAIPWWSSLPVRKQVGKVSRKNRTDFYVVLATGPNSRVSIWHCVSQCKMAGNGIKRSLSHLSVH